MISRSRRYATAITPWPGFVDVLSALLMVVIFVLMIFTLSQFLLGEVLFGQKNELARLHRQITELTDLLGLETEKSDRLQAAVSRLSDSIDALSEDREVLMAQVADLTEQADQDLADLQRQMMTIASLNEDILALRQVRDSLEQEVGTLAASLASRDQEAAVLRDRSMRLVAQLADKTEKTHLSQKAIAEQEIRIQALSAVLASQKTAIQEEQQLSASARAEVALLADQLDRLQQQLRQIQEALALARHEGEEKDVRIEDLGRQLNIALARKVLELEAYRSEFFGRLRQVLGDSEAIRIQGDRFVFQAELLFASGSAEVGAQGGRYLDSLAQTLLTVSEKIPGDIPWILQVDGHTDPVPIRNQQFASNWELSTARAVSVVRYLGTRGIPEHRMAAAGFSKYHPIDPASTPAAYERNRRIEIKLTSL